MSILSRHKDVEGDSTVPPGYQPLPQAIRDRIAGKLRAENPEGRLTPNPVVAFRLDGREIGAAGFVNAERPRDQFLDDDEFLVFNVAVPVDPHPRYSGPLLADQFDDWYVSADGRRCWRRGAAWPKPPEPLPAPPAVRGLSVGRPLAEGVLQRILLQHNADHQGRHSTRIESPGVELSGFFGPRPPSGPVVLEVRTGITVAYFPDTGASPGTFFNLEVQLKRDQYICATIDEPLYREQLELVRVTPSGRVAWLYPNSDEEDTR